jgi:hypothetical protein
MTIPTFNELFTSIQADLRNKLGITSIIGKVVLNAFALVQAAKLKLYYLSNAKVYKNIFPDQADPESLGGTLERFGVVKLDRLPTPATAGVYKINVTGEIAATIAAGTTWKSLDSSTSPDHLFVNDASFIFTTTSGIIEIRALDLGATARLEVADQLQVTAPIGNVDSFADVATIETSPTEAESEEEYRDTVIQAYREEPQGGARVDYKAWARDVPGVRDSYPYVKDGEAGVIDLFIEANPADSTDGNGTPPQSILDDVEAEIEPSKIPMGTFDINYLPVIPLAVDVEILNLSDLSFLTPIKNALIPVLFEIRPFIDGADDPNSRNKDKLYVADVVNVVRGVIGINATFDDVAVKVDSNLIVSFFQFEDDKIPFANTVINV